MTESNPPDKLGKLLQDIQNPVVFENSVLNRYIQEFEDKFSNILVQSESEFMMNFVNKMSLIYKEDYSEEAFENEEFSLHLKKAEKRIYEKFFKPIKNLLIKALTDYETTMRTSTNKCPSSLFLTSNFRKHCLYCDDFALHNCKGKFIPIYSNYGLNLDTDSLSDKIPKEGLKLAQNKSFEALTFVLCVGCKKAFLSKEIQMYCFTCNINYPTTVIRPEEVLLQPATWDNYHCGALLNDTMKCIKCRSTFFINTETNILECKQCGFQCDPLTIVWSCFLCMSEFSSNAKIYNPLEFKAVNRAIKNAVLEKKVIKPAEVTCCKLEIENTNFFHKKECQGVLYEGILEEQQIVVCEKCKMMNFYHRFIWTCPKCGKRFNQKKLLMKKLNSENSNEGAKFSVGRKSVLTDQVFGKKLNQINDKQNSKVTFKDPELEKKRTAQNLKINTKMKIESELYMTPVRQALKFTPYENVKGISMLRYTKMISKNVNPNDFHSEDTALNNARLNSNVKSDEPLYTNNNVITTAGNLETEVGETEPNEEVKKNQRKVRFKTIDEKDVKRDADPRILRPRNMTPVLKREEGKSVEREKKGVFEKKNFSVLNPFKHKKNASVNNGLLKNKKEYEETKRKTIFMEGSPLRNMAKNASDDECDDKVGRRKTKHLNINLNFHTIENYDLEKEDLEEDLKKDFDEEKLKEFNENQEDFEVNLDRQTSLPYFIVEDYRFVHQIGDGSFGCIYLCMDKNEVKFAIKKIIVKDKEKIEQISNEFELAHQMRHKNILQIYGISKRKLDQTTQVLYVLMELANNDWKLDISLRSKEKRYYSEEELIEIIDQIIDALAFMQQKGVAHRDIKPENILCFKSGIYKIADFGCAKIMAKSNLNTLKGTELFISPILYDALKNNIASEGVDHNAIKSDVYSLGLCALYAATLSLVPITEIRNISDHNSLYNYLKKVLRRYSQGFVNLIYRMLDLNEELRFDFFDLQDYLKK